MTEIIPATLESGMREPDNWSSLRGLMFTTKLLVEGVYAGGHASPQRGTGADFHDYRPYTPGDDVASRGGNKRDVIGE